MPHLSDFDSTHALLIVVGAHLRAEQADRPLAYRLRRAIEQWLERHEERLNLSLDPIVCSDIWYINQEALQQRPTISLGGPGVNALTAFFASKLPAAMGRDEKMIIQLDPEFVDLRVCIWGANHDLTVSALDVFLERYVDGYLRAVVTQVEPQI